MSQAAWSFAHYTCGHQTPVRGYDRHVNDLCPTCQRLVPAIAQWFAADYRENVTTEAWLETRYRNAQPDYANGCATHDFLDANECMAAAFEAILGHAPEPASDGDTALWNAAWNIAKPKYLTASDGECQAWDAALLTCDNDLPTIRAWRGHQGPQAGPVVWSDLLVRLNTTETVEALDALGQRETIPGPGWSYGKSPLQRLKEETR